MTGRNNGSEQMKSIHREQEANAWMRAECLRTLDTDNFFLVLVHLVNLERRSFGRD